MILPSRITSHDCILLQRLLKIAKTEFSEDCTKKGEYMAFLNISAGFSNKPQGALSNNFLCNCSNATH